MTEQPYKTFKGVFYFSGYTAAKDYAQNHSFPTDRIISFGRGAAIQLRVSGPYVGPKTGTPPQEAIKLLSYLKNFVEKHHAILGRNKLAAYQKRIDHIEFRLHGCPDIITYQDRF